MCSGVSARTTSSGALLTLPTSVTTASVSRSAAATCSPSRSGGTATTTSRGSTCPSATFAAPRPDAIRRFSDLTSRSATSTSRRRNASAIDVPRRPAPTTRTGPSVLIRDLAHTGEVAAQRRGPVQVDMGDVGARQVGLDVGEHPDDPWHGPLDLELAGADQRHLAEAEPAGGVGGELGDQVAG